MLDVEAQLLPTPSPEDCPRLFEWIPLRPCARETGADDAVAVILPGGGGWKLGTTVNPSRLADWFTM